jgi:hypothetical protein
LNNDESFLKKGGKYLVVTEKVRTFAARNQTSAEQMTL